MEKSINAKRTMVAWSCLLMLIIWTLFYGSTNAQGQYYTTVSSAKLDNSVYSVDRYSTEVPELRQLISLKAEHQTIARVLEAIVERAGLGIAYNAHLKTLKQKISVNFHSISVAEALQKVLMSTDYEPALTRMREVVLKKRSLSDKETLKVAFATQEISGMVTDAQSGKPLPSVNILVVGTGVGTSTDINGEYQLNAPDNADSLQFSFVGYKKVVVPINSRSVINIEMGAQTQTFNEMVVTALGIDREERSIGYSTQQVEGDDLTFSNEKNVIGALAGKVAGVQISGSSGASLGGTQTIKIRGVNSLSGEGQPLIVVDGTPISNANYAGSVGHDYGNLAQDINPNDIKSVNVMKGPAASSLYGIRGQYGVIMITTKDGSGLNDVRVEYSSNLSVQQAANFMPFQNTYGGGYSQEWETLPNGQKYVHMSADESWGPKMDGTPVRQYYSFFPQDPQYGQATPFVAHPNNIKDFYENGYTSDQGLTISGGGEHSNYRLSFDDTRINGVYPNTKKHSNNVGISAGIDASDDWHFSTDITYVTNSARRPPNGSEYGSRYFRQWFERQLDIDRLKNYQYADGTVMNWNLRSPSSTSGNIENLSPLYWSNPYWEANENTSEDSRDRFFGNVGVQYNPLPNLTFSGYIRGDLFTQDIEGKTNFGGASTPGYSVGKYQNKEMNYEFSGQYKRDWQNFSFEATVGTNLYDRDYTYLSQATVGGLTSPGYFNIDASVDRPINTSYKLDKRILSAYGLISLGYNETYFIDASLRNDKSSTLPKNNNSYWYPSVSGSFVFSELINWTPLTLGKLRLSYAQAGSDLSPYQTTPIYEIGTVYNGQNTLSVPDNINNPNIKPSFSTSYEAGIDLKFFDRIGANFTYYQQRNKNQIIPLNISGTSGYSTAIINAGLIENSGVELSLTGTPIQQRNFSWNSTLNISRNRNEVVRLHPDIDVYNHDYTVYSGTVSYLNSYEGESFGDLVGTAYQRDEATGKILLDDNNFPLYTDATHNFGTVLPDYTGGFQNQFHYKNFSLSAMINFQVGGQFFSRSLMLASTTGLAPKTVAMNDQGHSVRDQVDEGGGVKIEGISESTGEPVSTYVNAYDYYHAIPRDVYEDWVTDASYIKLSEIRIGYTFTSESLRNIPVKSIGVALFANNPLMIWQAAPQGLDPSELSSGSQDITWFESGQLNTVRTLGLNVNLTF